MKTQYEMEFACRMQMNSVEQSPYMTAKTSALLIRYAKQLHAIYTRQCNGYSAGIVYKIDSDLGRIFATQNQKSQERDERKEITLQSKITVLLAEINPSLVPIFQGDPRGMPVRVVYNSEVAEAERTGSLGFYIPIR